MYYKFLDYLMDNCAEKVISERGIAFRRIISPVVRGLAGFFAGVGCTVLNETELPPGPKIFAVTHTYNAEDVIWGLAKAGEQSYLLTNSVYEVLHSVGGVALWLAGVVLFDPSDSASRKASLEKMRYALELGANVTIFPEGTWNQTPNLLVQNLYPGVYTLAVQTGALVVPMSTMMYEKQMYIRKGVAMNLAQMTRADALEALRDQLAGMKWEIMVEFGRDTRDGMLKGSTPEEYWYRHREEYIARQDFYERGLEDNARYITKEERTQREVERLLCVTDSLFAQ